MPDLLSLMRAFRASLLANDRRTAQALGLAYQNIYRRIGIEIDALVRRIEEAQAAGIEINRNWLYRAGRLAELKRQVEAEIDRYARIAGGVIEQAQTIAITAASLESIVLLESVFPVGLDISFTALPRSALIEIVGALQDNTPLRRLLERMGADTAAVIERALHEGLALGHGPRVVARAMRQGAGLPLERALRISRTEMLRAYRGASIANYRANSDVVGGWIWTASLSARSCAMCISMHGTKHALDEDFASHVNCRCAPIPYTASFRELGVDVPEPDRSIESGDAWFARQSPDTQRAVLGNAGYKAFEAGEVRLKDFRGSATSREWGKSRYARSLKEILGAKRAVKFYSRAA